MSTEREEFDKAYQLLNPNVKKNTTIVLADDKNPYALHISKIKQKYLTPNISKKSSANEDNTVVRVYVSDNLLGCIIGYYSLIHESIFNQSTENGFKNIYYLHYIPYNFAIKPNSKLVYDADVTNEYWLIPYNKNTVKYKTDKISEFFVNETTITPNSIKDNVIMKNYKLTIYSYFPIPTITYYSNNDINKPVILKGYYKLYMFSSDYMDYKIIGHEEINKSVFEDSKKQISIENMQLEVKNKIKLLQSSSKAILSSKNPDVLKVANKYLEISLEGLMNDSGMFSLTYRLIQDQLKTKPKQSHKLIESVTNGHLMSLKHQINTEGLLETREVNTDNDDIKDTPSKLCVYNNLLVDSVDALDELSIIDLVDKTDEPDAHVLHSDIVNYYNTSLGYNLTNEDFKESVKDVSSKSYDLFKRGLFKSSILLKKMSYGLLSFIDDFKSKTKNIMITNSKLINEFSVLKRSKRDLKLKEKTLNLHLVNTVNDNIENFKGETDEAGAVGVYTDHTTLLSLLSEYTLDIKQLKNNFKTINQLESNIFKNKAQLLSFIEGKDDANVLSKLSLNINVFVKGVMSDIYFGNRMYGDPDYSIYYDGGKLDKSKKLQLPNIVKYSITKDDINSQKEIIEGFVNYLSALSDLNDIINSIYSSSRSEEIIVLTNIIKTVDKLSKNKDIDKEELQKYFINIKDLYKSISNYKTIKVNLINDLTKYLYYQIENMENVMKVIHLDK